MHLIWTILIGFVAGLIAKAITPGTGPGARGAFFSRLRSASAARWRRLISDSSWAGTSRGNLQGLLKQSSVPSCCWAPTIWRPEISWSNPGIVEELSGFYAQHADLIKTPRRGGANELPWPRWPSGIRDSDRQFESSPSGPVRASATANAAPAALPRS